MEDDLERDLRFLSYYSSDDENDVRRAERIREKLSAAGITEMDRCALIHSVRQHMQAERSESPERSGS
jgi:hypothetical protein